MVTSTVDPVTGETIYERSIEQRAKYIVDNFGDHVGHDGYFKIHRKRFISTLCFFYDQLLKSRRLMEIGSYGLMVHAMAELAPEAVVDVSIFDAQKPKGVQDETFFGKAAKAYNLDVERELFNCPDGSYDTIVCMEVMEHFATDPMHFLAEANRILAPGGCILITTPNIAASENIFRILWRQVPNSYYVYRLDRSSDRHNLEYGPDLLVKTLAAAGFTVGPIATDYFWSQRNDVVERILREFNFPTELRGDDLMVIAFKTSSPVERMPAFLYG